MRGRLRTGSRIRSIMPRLCPRMVRQAGLRGTYPAKGGSRMVRIDRLGGVISWVYARRGQPLVADHAEPQTGATEWCPLRKDAYYPYAVRAPPGCIISRPRAAGGLASGRHASFWRAIVGQTTPRPTAQPGARAKTKGASKARGFGLYRHARRNRTTRRPEGVCRCAWPDGSCVPDMPTRGTGSARQTQG